MKRLKNESENLTVTLLWCEENSVTVVRISISVRERYTQRDCGFGFGKN